MTEDLPLRIAMLERQVAGLTKTAARQVEEGLPAEVEGMEGKLADALQPLEPLRPLLDDDSVNDILINGPANVFVERAGKLEKTNLQFPSDAKVFAIAQAIAAHIGRSVNVRCAPRRTSTSTSRARGRRGSEAPTPPASAAT